MHIGDTRIVNDKVKILCPYCLENEINPSQAICAVCYAKDDELERDHWNRLRERNNADEIQMYTLAKRSTKRSRFRNMKHTCAGRNTI